MTLLLYIAGALIALTCLTFVTFAVYLARARRERAKRQRTVKIAIQGDESKLRDALRPIGGSYRNCEPERRR